MKPFKQPSLSLHVHLERNGGGSEQVDAPTFLPQSVSQILICNDDCSLKKNIKWQIPWSQPQHHLYITLHFHNNRVIFLLPLFIFIFLIAENCMYLTFWKRTGYFPCLCKCDLMTYIVAPVEAELKNRIYKSFTLHLHSLCSDSDRHFWLWRFHCFNDYGP